MSTFSDFVESYLGKDRPAGWKLSPEQRTICEKYADWRRRGKTGGSKISIIPGGKAESMLEIWWDAYKEQPT